MHFSGEIYSTACVEWADDHFGLSLHKSMHFWRRYEQKTIFTLSFTMTLNF